MTIVGSHLWLITCYVVHYCFSSSRPRNGLYHQCQAVLRNSPGPASTLFTLIQLGWIWRKSASPYSQLPPIILLAILLAVGNALASGFSSRVAISNDAGSEVLLSGSRCALKMNDIPKINFNEYQGLLFSGMTGALSSAANYVDECHQKDNAPSRGCKTFMKPNLKPIVDRTIPCPFEDLCYSRNATLRLDSGLLDSNDDLGINAPENERFLYRKVTECAPLRTDGFKSSFNVSSDRSYSGYLYGQSSRDNYTYCYSNDSLYDTNHNLDYLQADYSIGYVY